MIIKPKVIRNCILFSFCLLIFSCKKNDTIDNNGIPYVQVNLTIYSSDPVFSTINAVGGWTYLTGGSKGIILYHKSNDEFMALDRHSTYKPENGCVVSVDNSGVIAVDTCSKSEFFITDGYVSKGPATIPLKAYQTKFDGNALRIFN